MNALLLKAAPWALAVVLVGGLVAGFARHERDLGALRVQLQTADSLAASAEAELADAQRRATTDSTRAAHLEADTAIANARARLADSRYFALSASYSHAKASLDSLLAQTPDSASPGLVASFRAYEHTADSTIHACTDAVTADSAALAACQAHGQALQATLTDTRQMVQALQKDTVAKALKIRVLAGNQPSAAKEWLARLAAFGLGILAGRVGR
ncbi:MAG: hypothetical protein KGI71_05440 [Patescibacteria group bacterium]|nr:hypothetical protein [Patescibacteria group bacterium]